MNKNKLMYCVHCEELNEVLESLAGDFHYRSEFSEYGFAGVHPCYGPFTSSEPQPLPVGWENFVTEPTDNEIAISNLVADELVNGSSFDIDLAKSNLAAVDLLEDFSQ